ncbi:hypothetical protein B7486_53035, partial [cyanobacterium TDX16]
TPENGDGNRELFLATCSGPGQPFTDVGRTHPFFGEIGWMAARGVSLGYQPGPTYRPSAPVTRGAMSAFMFRLAGAEGFVPPATNTFRDVDAGHPFHVEVEWMAAAGISTGYPGGTYRPSDAVSRGAMSAFMFRLAGQLDRTLPDALTFTDVGRQHPFAPEIEWMALKGISTGYEPGPTYRPAAPVTRAAMSAFMFRLAAAYPNLGED